MLDFSDPLFFWSLTVLLGLIAFILIGGCWMSLLPKGSNDAVEISDISSDMSATLAAPEGQTKPAYGAAPPSPHAGTPQYLRRSNPRRPT
ncbi:MAG: hypothetical protein MRY59_02590 [Aquisalinus sp.]|nr:hypothetical protein [Aquisalinus sp.]